VAAKTREDDLDGALLLKLHERLAQNDIRLLEVCWKAQDIDLVSQPPLRVHQVAWLMHYGLLRTRIDKIDRIWIETTPLGRDLVVYIRKHSAPRTAAS